MGGNRGFLFKYPHLKMQAIEISGIKKEVSTPLSILKFSYRILTHFTKTNIYFMFNQKKRFELTTKEQAVEVVGIAFFLAVLVGSFLKVLFL